MSQKLRGRMEKDAAQEAKEIGIENLDRIERDDAGIYVDPAYEVEAQEFNAGARINVPIQSILDADSAELLSATLQGDIGALELPSEHAPQNLPPRWDGQPATEGREAMVRHAAQAGATLKSARSSGLVSPLEKAAMSELLKGMNELPNPDVTTWVNHRKVTISGDVTSTPNKLDKTKAMKQLRIFLGGECVKEQLNENGTYKTKCVCPTHKIARCAQNNGFRDKPLLWLSQKIAEFLADRQLWKKLPDDGAYNREVDEDMTNGVAKALAQLISGTNVYDLLDTCRGRTSLQHAFQVLCNMAIEADERIRKPLEYAAEFDV